MRNANFTQNIHKLTSFSHESRQKLQNTTCYDPYILLSPRPHSYICGLSASLLFTNASDTFMTFGSLIGLGPFSCHAYFTPRADLVRMRVMARSWIHACCPHDTKNMYEMKECGQHGYTPDPHADKNTHDRKRALRIPSGHLGAPNAINISIALA